MAPPAPHDPNSILECTANSSSAFRPACVNLTSVNLFGWDIGCRLQSCVYITPTCLPSYLDYVYNTWKTPVAITEFGFPVFAESEKALPDQLFDTPRSTYYLGFMSEVLKSIWEDVVEVNGAFAWSFADNWEFGDFGAQFGLKPVNHTTPVGYFNKSLSDMVDFMGARDA